MNRLVLMLRVTVKDGERAFLMRNGRFERVLEPGRHPLFDPLRGLAVELHHVVRAEFPAERYAVLKAARPDLAAEMFEPVETKADEVAIVSLDGRPSHLMGPWQSARVLEGRDRRRGRAHRRGGRPEGRAASPRDGGARAQHAGRRARGREPRGGSALRRGPAGGAARAGPARLLDRGPQDRGQAPRPASAGGRDHRAGDADQGPHRAARDADRVPPDRRSGAAGSGGADVDAWLYRLVQFAIREAVASRTLDEVLSAKNALDAELRAYVRERVAETGIEVTELGVKDVILPGEIRELVNKVVEAERTAKANLIRRQEETAATRSLLNTAKLMEDNPLLLRLKELESIERLVEKVGRIDLHAGDGAASMRCSPSSCA